MRSETTTAPAQDTTTVPHLPWFKQFRLLLRLLITDYRSAAPFLLLIGIALPLGFLWILSQYIETGQQSVWLLAGNVIMAICFGSVSFAIQRTALMKVEGELDYYGSLSISKSAFIAAVFLESIVFALPALFTSLIIGHYLLDIPWSNIVMAVPVALLAASSLTIVGSTLGSYAKNMAHFAIFSYLPYLAVIFLSPVLLPLDKLPLPLQITSYILPTGQASIAMNEVLNNRYNLELFLLVVALCVWVVIAAAIAFKKLDWRTE